MKKLLALLLAGILVLALVACNTTDINEDPENWDDGEVVNEITMTFGDDESKITLYKPDDASFSVDPEDAQDAGDIVIMLADDYSWDAEIMGYKHYEGISSNEPFVEAYFDGAASDDYVSYEETVTELGISYEGKPVKLIRYTYQEVDDEETYSECFVGFEYKGSDDSGLFGLKIGSFEEELSESYLKDLFTQTFTAK